MTDRRQEPSARGNIDGFSTALVEWVRRRQVEAALLVAFATTDLPEVPFQEDDDEGNE